MKNIKRAAVMVLTAGIWYFTVTTTGLPSGLKTIINMPDQDTCEDVASAIAVNNAQLRVSACHEVATPTPGCGLPGGHC